MTLQRLSVMSCAKMLACGLFLVGLIVAAKSVVAGYADHAAELAFLGVIRSSSYAGFVAMLVPCFAAAGAIAGAGFAVFYNLLASLVGGIRFEIK